ncbi:hypothetical protein BBK36DRAFT_1112729 [Trichoderma citrinoviride]|uniref:Uncharacterized protein n=1 Tax=Trichoderma citrinoviride TaxID=58853 RepID=A0A2T4BI87_9HYPO|nr:hypothetical protein BBK36DRAFT_1112729 [Trichoderma citrinoviride]PTB68998.1 hypothetical protein BBK36DRAFT_1112729 [Trichoderma citrinoviride]
MAPNTHTQMHTISDNDAEAVLQSTLHGTLQGTFHTPVMPTPSMSMTSYVHPGSSSSSSSSSAAAHQPLPNYAIGAPVMWVETGAPEAANFPYMITHTGERYDIAQYTDCKADSGIDQINGVVIVCDAGTTDDDDIKSPRGKYFYQGCKKLGSGAQVNGLELVYHGGSQKVPTLPGMPGRWDKVDMLNAEGKEIKGVPKNQINGGRIRLMKRSDMGSMSG